SYRPATSAPHTLSLHDALPISVAVAGPGLEALHDRRHPTGGRLTGTGEDAVDDRLTVDGQRDGLAQLRVGQRRVHVLRRERHGLDRKSTRLNSSHVKISYAVFC